MLPVHALDDRRRVLENVHADRTVEINVYQLPRYPHRRIRHCVVANRATSSGLLSLCWCSNHRDALGRATVCFSGFCARPAGEERRRRGRGRRERVVTGFADRAEHVDACEALWHLDLGASLALAPLCVLPARAHTHTYVHTHIRTRTKTQTHRGTRQTSRHHVQGMAHKAKWALPPPINQRTSTRSHPGSGGASRWSGTV